VKTCVMLFNIPQKAVSELRIAAVRMGLSVINVQKERFGYTLSRLLEGEIAAMPVEEPFTEQMAVFCHTDDKTLNGMIALLKKARCGGCLKAVLTETNALWTAQQLYGELCREREAFAKGEQAHGEQ